MAWSWTTATTGRAGGRPSAGAAGVAPRRVRRSGASARGRGEIELTALGGPGSCAGTPLPPTAELFLVPVPRPTRRGPRHRLVARPARPGRRVSGAFPPRPRRAARPRLRRDRRRRAAPAPQRRAVDVAFAPSAALADLCTHPPNPPAHAGAVPLERGRGTIWPPPISSSGRSDPALPMALGAADPPEGHDTIVPSPLLRARSATAAPGAARLLVGWSLQRQHAPWAFTPGPLADLAFLPRLVVDGFVIAPASWRLPPALRQGVKPAGGGRPRALAARGRRAADGPGRRRRRALPRRSAGARRRRQSGRRTSACSRSGRRSTSVVDRDGRRVEAIVAVVDEDGDGEAPAGPAARPPRARPTAPSGTAACRLAHLQAVRRVRPSGRASSPRRSCPR